MNTSVENKNILIVRVSYVKLPSSFFIARLDQLLTSRPAWFRAILKLSPSYVLFDSYRATMVITHRISGKASSVNNLLSLKWGRCAKQSKTVGKIIHSSYSNECENI